MELKEALYTTRAMRRVKPDPIPEDAVKAMHPELLLGTQMERHIAKRLGVPCAVISAPMHVQDFPARYAPQMGFEGAQ